MSTTLESDALVILRALYDLADADVCPTLDLFERLLGVDKGRGFALITQLRAAGLMPPDRLGLTMAGLAVAVALPATEPRPMLSAVRPSCAA
ncbi:MAG: hypothetical protein AAGF11_13345 [Myxococcota bacterium]